MRVDLERRARVTANWLPAIAVVLSLHRPALAAFPPRVSDEELARRPVLVIARWAGAPMIEVDLAREMRGTPGNRTELVVERVIAGDLKPGRHEVIIGPFLSWSAIHPTVTCPTSSFLITDIKPEEPNLWLLQRTRAVKNDPNVYLSANDYRGVRRVGTGPYFLALRGKDPRVEIPKLLTSKDREIVLLALDWVCGGRVPEPYFEDDLPLRPISGFPPPDRKPLKENLPAVEALLGHGDPVVRREAACVVGDWAGTASLPRMRRLLADPDPGARAIAVVTLAALDDRESSDAINSAVRGIDNREAGKVICALAAWKNPRVVPALIGYLQNDRPASSVEDLQVLCLLARAALRQVTGHTFPLDVRASERVWRQAETIHDAGRRDAFLTGAMPHDPDPLSAELVRDTSGFAVVVTNTSRRPLLLARTPQQIDVDYKIELPGGGSRGGGGGGGFDRIVKVTGKGSFVELKPGGSTRFPYEGVGNEEGEGFGEDFFLAGPGSREVKLSYRRNGHEYGLNAWVGTLTAGTKLFGNKK
jgi:hypothetical protein